MHPVATARDMENRVRGEVKGNFATWPALRRVIPQVNRVAEAWPAPSLRGRDPAAWPCLV